MKFLCASFVVAVTLGTSAWALEPLRFKRQQIDNRVGEVCYALTVADVDGDGRRDIVALSEDALVWYHNPNWIRQDIIRGLTVRDNVCVQANDLDGDRRTDFVVGAGWRPADTTKPSTLQWVARDSSGAWKVTPIPCEEPTLHRIRFGDVKGTGRDQLVVAPLQGRGTRGPNWGEGAGTRILVYDIPRNPAQDTWSHEVVCDSLHTVHNLQLVNLDSDPQKEILAAAWEGVFILDRGEDGHWTRERIGKGAEDATPFKGASEIKLGRMRDGHPFIATIEPWHGQNVVVYHPPASRGPQTLRNRGPWVRKVIAQPLKWGHAVWCADLDADGDEEIVIGQRDPNPIDAPGPRGPGIFVFDPVPAPQPNFKRITIDDGGVACEDALAVDLDGDRLPEIIAGGRASHNVVIYWNQTSKAEVKK